MDRARALSVLAEMWDEAPLIRLAEASLAACLETEMEGNRQRDEFVDGSFRARAGRIRAARVGVKKNS